MLVVKGSRQTTPHPENLGWDLSSAVGRWVSQEKTSKTLEIFGGKGVGLKEKSFE